MKSERAKNILRDYRNLGFTPSSSGDWRDVKVGYVTAVQAIEQAEADARERAIKAFQRSCGQFCEARNPQCFAFNKQCEMDCGHAKEYLRHYDKQ